MLKVLEDNNVDVVYVLANCMNCLQPLDLSVNKPVKDCLKGKFVILTKCWNRGIQVFDASDEATRRPMDDGCPLLHAEPSGDH